MKKISQPQPVQEHKENIGSTRVTIEPSYQSIIQSAVDFINQKDPSILRDITDIFGHVDRSGLFGEYVSGSGSEHTIYVDINNIQNKVKSAMQGASDEQIKNEIRNQIIKTIVHESKHEQEHSTTGHSSEMGPERAESDFERHLTPISSRDKGLIR